MRTFRLIVPTILFAVVLVGCVIQADSHSDQSPFAPTATPTATQEPPISSAPTLSAQQTSAEEEEGWVTISWNAVDNAAYYEIEEKQGDVPWELLEEGPQTGTSISLPLPIGVKYNFRARALNSRGEGPWSAVISVTLAKPTPVPPTPTPVP